MARFAISALVALLTGAGGRRLSEVEPTHLGCYLDSWSDLYEDKAGTNEVALADNSPTTCNAACASYTYFVLKEDQRCLCGTADPTTHGDRAAYLCDGTCADPSYNVRARGLLPTACCLLPRPLLSLPLGRTHHQLLTRANAPSPRVSTRPPSRDTTTHPPPRPTHTRERSQVCAPGNYISAYQVVSGGGDVECATVNVVEENAAGVGGWGGECTCPDGQVYGVGDNGDSCGSLACVGGTSGTCNMYTGDWSNRRVTCGALCPPTPPTPPPVFSMPVGPPAPAFAVSALLPLNSLSTATLGGYAPGQVHARSRATHTPAHGRLGRRGPHNARNSPSTLSPSHPPTALPPTAPSPLTCAYTLPTSSIVSPPPPSFAHTPMPMWALAPPSPPPPHTHTHHTHTHAHAASVARALTLTQLKLIDISRTIDLELMFSAAAVATAADGSGILVFAPSHAGSLGLYDATASSFTVADPGGAISGMSTTQSRFGGAAAVAAAAGGSLVATNAAEAAAKQIVVFSPANAAEVGVYDANASGFALADISVCPDLDRTFESSTIPLTESTCAASHRACVCPSARVLAHVLNAGDCPSIPRAQVRRRRRDVHRQPGGIRAAAVDWRRSLRR